MLVSDTLRPLLHPKVAWNADNVLTGVRKSGDGTSLIVETNVGVPHRHPHVGMAGLLDLYTNRPFDNVFAAIRRVEEHLQPVFVAGSPEPFQAGPQAYTTRKQIKEMVQLHASGRSVQQIADSTGKAKSTVHRHLKRANTPSAKALE